MSQDVTFSCWKFFVYQGRKTSDANNANFIKTAVEVLNRLVRKFI